MPHRTGALHGATERGASERCASPVGSRARRLNASRAAGHSRSMKHPFLLSFRPKLTHSSATFAVRTALGALLLACPALAQGGAARAGAELETTQGSALPVHLALDRGAPSERVILERLEAELGVRVEQASSGETGLFIDVKGETCRARYASEPGQASERTITLPQDPEQRLTVITLLADNLVRDEGAALLARLEAEAAASGEANVGQTASAVGVAAGQTTEAPEGETPSAEKPSSANGNVAGTKAVDAELEHGPAREELPLAPVSLTLLSPVSTHPRLFERRAGFSLGLLYTDLGELEGMSVDGLVLHNRHGGEGATVSGIWSHSGGHFDGVRFAGLGDSAVGGAHGAQFAGLVATQAGETEGAQVAGLVGVGDAVEGTQIAGLAAVSESVEGTQIAGLAAVSESVEGAQIGGLLNTSGDVTGAQIGLINIAGGKVHGTQIGLVNIGRGMRGAAIGLVNINPDIDVSALAWGSVRYVPQGNPQFSSAPMGHVGVRYQSGIAYTIVGLGLGGREGCGDPDACPAEAVFAPGVGGGVRIPVAGPLSVDVDGYYQWEFGAETGVSPGGSVQLRGAAALELAPAFTVFAGGGPRLDFDDEAGDVAGSPAFFAGIQLF